MRRATKIPHSATGLRPRQTACSRLPSPSCHSKWNTYETNRRCQSRGRSHHDPVPLNPRFSIMRPWTMLPVAPCTKPESVCMQLLFIWTYLNQWPQTLDKSWIGLILSSERTSQSARIGRRYRFPPVHKRFARLCGFRSFRDIRR